MKGTFQIPHDVNEHHTMLSPRFNTMFNGIEFARDDNAVTRRNGIMTILRWQEFLTTLGWYEHTNDWDIETSVELYDGTAVTDMCMIITFDKPLGDNAISMQHKATHIIIHDVEPADDNGSGGYIERRPPHMPKRKRDYRIAIDKIAKIKIGAD